jgi:hypothetical protein
MVPGLLWLAIVASEAIVPVVRTALVRHLSLGLAEQPAVVFRVLQEVLGCHPIARKLRIPRKDVVLLDDLLRCTPHLSLWSGAFKHAVDDVSNVTAISVASRLVSGAGLVGWSHALNFPPLLAKPGQTAAAVSDCDLIVPVP